MGKGPSMPEQPVIPPIPSPVKETSEDIRQAGIDEKEKLKRRRGYESTMLRQPGLDANNQPLTAKKALLG